MFDVRPRAGLREPEACALCAIADAMYAFAEEDKRCRVVSASVGSVSETYAAPPELCAETIQSREGYLRALAQDYLVFGRYASGGALTVPPVLPDRYLLPCGPGDTYHHAHRCAGRTL